MSMMIPNLNFGMSTSIYGPVTSTSQIVNETSKLDLASIGGQPMPLIARVPGISKEQVVQVAPDFDDAMEFGI